MADSSGHYSICCGVSPADDLMWDLGPYGGEVGFLDAPGVDEKQQQQQQKQPALTDPGPAAAAACHNAPSVFGDTMTDEDWQILEQLESAFGCHNSMASSNRNAWQQQQQQQQQLLPMACRTGSPSPACLPQYHCSPLGAAAAAAAVPTSMPSVYQAGAPGLMQHELVRQQQQQQGRFDLFNFCIGSPMDAAFCSAAITDAEVEGAIAAAAAALDPNLSANSDHTADAHNASGCSSLLGSRSPVNATAAAAVAAAAMDTDPAVSKPHAAAAAAAATATAAIALKRCGSRDSSRAGKGQRISRARHDQEMAHLFDQVEQLTNENKRLQQRTATLMSSEQDMLKRVATLTEKWRASVAANDDLQRENIALRQQLLAMQQQQY